MPRLEYNANGPQKKLRREVDIAGVPHVVSISAMGVSIVKKGCRNGSQFYWERLNDTAPMPVTVHG